MDDETPAAAEPAAPNHPGGEEGRPEDAAAVAAAGDEENKLLVKSASPETAATVEVKVAVEPNEDTTGDGDSEVPATGDDGPSASAADPTASDLAKDREDDAGERKVGAEVIDSKGDDAEEAGAAATATETNDAIPIGGGEGGERSSDTKEEDDVVTRGGGVTTCPPTTESNLGEQSSKKDDNKAAGDDGKRADVVDDGGCVAKSVVAPVDGEGEESPSKDTTAVTKKDPDPGERSSTDVGKVEVKVVEGDDVKSKDPDDASGIEEADRVANSENGTPADSTAPKINGPSSEEVAEDEGKVVADVGPPSGTTVETASKNDDTSGGGDGERGHSAKDEASASQTAPPNESSSMMDISEGWVKVEAPPDDVDPSSSSATTTVEKGAEKMDDTIVEGQTEEQHPAKGGGGDRGGGPLTEEDPTTTAPSQPDNPSELTSTGSERRVVAGDIVEEEKVDPHTVVEGRGGRRRSGRTRSTPQRGGYSERQLLRRAIEESKKSIAAAEAGSKRKRVAESVGSDTKQEPSKKKGSKHSKVAPKRNMPPAKDGVEKDSNNKKRRKDDEVGEEDGMESTDVAPPAGPTRWQTTGSGHIGKTCRRAVPPQFHHLTRSDMYIKNPSESSAVASSAYVTRLSDATVVAWKPSYKRTPTLYRIVHPVPDDFGGDRLRYAEEVTEEELLSGMASASKRQNSSLTMEQIAAEQSKMQYYWRACDAIANERVRSDLLGLLPQLIVAALQELTLERKVQNFLAEEMADSEESSGGGDLTMMFSKPRYGEYGVYSDVYKATRAAARSRGWGGDSTAYEGLAGGRGESATGPDSSGGSRTISFAGSAIGQRLRQGAAMAYEALRRFSGGTGTVDGVAKFEAGGRVASLLVQSPEDGYSDPRSLADAAKRVSTKDIQSVALESLLWRPSSSKRKKTTGKEEAPPLVPQFRLKCESGDAETEFSRAKFTLVSSQSQAELEEEHLEKNAEEAIVQLSDEELLAQKKLHEEHQKQQELLQKRIGSLLSGGFATYWPKWSDAALTILREAEEAEKKAAAAAALEQADTNGKHSNIGTKQYDRDEALAKELASQEEQLSGDPVIDEASGALAPRRSRRRPVAADVTSGVVFYGSASGLTQIQVNESVHRLLMECHPRFLTFLDVRRLLLNENEAMGSTYREMRKIRTALLKLVYWQGKVRRMYVSNSTDDAAKSPLASISSPSADIVQNASHNVPALATATQSTPSISTIDKSEALRSLLPYFRELHDTEHSLRSMILSVLQISPLAVAASADHDATYDLDDGDESASSDDEDSNRANSAETSHPLLGHCVLRPDGSKWRVDRYTLPIPLDDEEESIGDLGRAHSEEGVSGTKVSALSLPENRIVKRRGRFTLSPWKEDEGDDADSANLTLTQAQVQAGIEAHKLKQQIRQMRGGFNVCRRLFRSRHPMKNKLDTRLTLQMDDVGDDYARTNAMNHTNGEDGTGNAESTFTGTVVSYNSETDPPSILVLPDMEDENASKTDDKQKAQIESISSSSVNEVEAATDELANMDYEKLLVIVERDEESKQVPAAVEKDIEDPTDATMETPKSTAFWATLVDNGTAVEFMSDQVGVGVAGRTQTPSPSKKRKARIIGWHQGSNPSMEASAGVLEWLKSHPKANPFLEKVDPVALNLPDYFSVIKRPMDIGTVEHNLTHGKYSDIDGNVRLDEVSATGRSSSSFRGDLMLMFDNAMRYNAEGSWIHSDAAWLKKNTIRKLDAAARKLLQSGQTSGRRRTAATTYNEDDDDESFGEADGDYNDDIDGEEEDDDDDEDYHAGRGRRARRKPTKAALLGRPSAVADAATWDVMEMSYKLSEVSSSISPFLDTDASAFSLPQSWSCRRREVKKPSTKRRQDTTSASGVPEASALVRLMYNLMQSSTLYSQRRSTRQQRAAAAAASSSVGPGGGGSDGLVVEYFLRDDPLVCGVNRTQVEMIREAMHERFAALYGELLASDAAAAAPTATVHPTSKGSNGVVVSLPPTISGDANLPTAGSAFDGGIFPPYLGRVCPATGRWEIRSSLILPALRWVVSGLVRSGHLGGDFGEGVATAAWGGGGGGAATVTMSNAYYWNKYIAPLDVVEPPKKTGQQKDEDEEEEEEEEVELSEYEKARLDRVARNKERLKALGLG